MSNLIIICLLICSIIYIDYLNKKRKYLKSLKEINRRKPIFLTNGNTSFISVSYKQEHSYILIECNSYDSNDPNVKLLVLFNMTIYKDLKKFIKLYNNGGDLTRYIKLRLIEDTNAYKNIVRKSKLTKLQNS